MDERAVDRSRQYTARRSRSLPFRWDQAAGRAMAATPLTVRVDLQ
jgi:hypothetical protein